MLAFLFLLVGLALYGVEGLVFTAALGTLWAIVVFLAIGLVGYGSIAGLAARRRELYKWPGVLVVPMMSPALALVVSYVTLHAGLTRWGINNIGPTVVHNAVLSTIGIIITIVIVIWAGLVCTIWMGFALSHDMASGLLVAVARRVLELLLGPVILGLTVRPFLLSLAYGPSSVL